MEDKLTQAVEDYLKAIYELNQTEKRASTSKLAEYLDVTPASVTGMIKKLASAAPPLVDYQKHHGVVLTEAGLSEALETLRHHRLLELFLHDILGYPWDEVHEEAERLEHVISEKFEARIAAVLGNPKHDPHGDPIPRLDLSMPASAETRLSDLAKGDSGTIKRVRDTDADLLRHLSDLGVTPEANVKVVDYSEYDKNTHLKINDQDEVVVLGQNITEQIYVEA